GFTMFRSIANDPQLAAAQDTVTVGAVMVYGFGQYASNILPLGGWSAGPPHTEIQAVYGAPLLLAEGTYTGSFGLDNVVNYTAVVFAADSGTDAIGIPQGLEVIFTPEPATMSLLLIGAVGALVRRRR
ncbi:MAG: PEP-CTERM sorting domain-containing protein, partial [Planctomycetes bacterium]|nr:PEP-CTERM sorting domain-containing protein [Planctomycetota bacterium]